MSWYGEGLGFACTGCGDCCSGEPGAVWVGPEEIERLAAFLGLDQARFERQYLRRLGPRRALHERPSGDCCFLDPDDRRCLVYPARPVQCSTYPFWDPLIESPEAWARVCKECEGAREPGDGFVPAAEIVERARALRRAREG